MMRAVSYAQDRTTTFRAEPRRRFVSARSMAYHVAYSLPVTNRARDGYCASFHISNTSTVVENSEHVQSCASSHVSREHRSGPPVHGCAAPHLRDLSTLLSRPRADLCGPCQMRAVRLYSHRPAGENGRMLMCRETLDGHVEGTRSR